MKKGTKLLVGAALGAAAGAAAYKALKKEEKPATPVTYDSIRPGQVWLDTNGKPIQAHGFSVFYDPKEATYYWYGENKEDTKKGGTVWTKGIRYYASADLYNWEDRGYLIPPSDDLNDPLHPTYCIDRPHILYCEATKKYVCWIKVMAAGRVAGGRLELNRPRSLPFFCGMLQYRGSVRQSAVHFFIELLPKPVLVRDKGFHTIGENHGKGRPFRKGAPLPFVSRFASKRCIPADQPGTRPLRRRSLPVVM